MTNTGQQIDTIIEELQTASDALSTVMDLMIEYDIEYSMDELIAAQKQITNVSDSLLTIRVNRL